LASVGTIAGEATMKSLSKFLPLAALALLAGATTSAQAVPQGAFVTAASKSCTASPCTLSVTPPEEPFFLLEGVYCQITQTVGLTTLSLPIPVNDGGTGNPVIAIPLLPAISTTAANLIGNITLPAVIEFTGDSPVEVIAVGTFSARSPATLTCTIAGLGPTT
jgi:hypothetical protein